MMDGSQFFPLGFLRLKFTIGTKRFCRNFLVLKTPSHVVLGMDFLKSFNMVLDFSQNLLLFRNSKMSVTINLVSKMQSKLIRILNNIKAGSNPNPLGQL